MKMNELKGQRGVDAVRNDDVSLALFLSHHTGSIIAFILGRSMLYDYAIKKIDKNKQLKALSCAVSGKNGFKVMARDVLYCIVLQKGCIVLCCIIEEMYCIVLYYIHSHAIAQLVVLCRMATVFPFALLNYAFGVTKIDIVSYSVASCIGTQQNGMVLWCIVEWRVWLQCIVIHSILFPFFRFTGLIPGIALYCIAAQQAHNSSGGDWSSVFGVVLSLVAVVIVSWYAKVLVDRETKEQKVLVDRETKEQNGM